MKRILSVLSLLVLVTAFLVVVGAAGASHSVKSPVKGSFKYCDDPTFPPMESKTVSGKPIGFDIDMANAIGKLWKVKAKFPQTAFPGLLPALASKKCNMVISGIFVTPDRVKQFPAAAYMRTHRALVVQGGNPKRIKGPDDLSGKTVAVQAGTKYEEFLNALNDQFKSSGKAQMNLQSYPGDTDAVAQLLASFDRHLFWEALTSKPYRDGALLALELTLVSLAAACVIGFFLALGRGSRSRWIRGIVFLYNWIFRATPTLLQLIFIWYALPQLWPVFAGSWFKVFLAAFIALALNEAAYMSEIIRAGLLSVDPGQELAGRALGMTRRQILRKVIVPQAVRIVIPPTGNEFITLLKLTSLAFVISLHELLTAGQELAAATFQYTEPLLASLVYYLVIVSILMILQGRLEKRFTWSSAGRRRRRVAPAAVPTVSHDAR